MMAGLFINSETYWNARFAGDWDPAKGREQTRFFADLALRHFPRWLVNDIRTERLSVVDWGCAEGQGVQAFVEAFPDSAITGVDFAERALAHAKSLVPQCTFKRSLEADERFDVAFSSNTLEHFADPLPALRALLSRGRRYAVLLLPFREQPRIEEHLYTFDLNSFPLQLGEHHLIYYRTIDCSREPDTHWPGQQILVVYGSEAAVDLGRFHLQSLVQSELQAAMDRAASWRNPVADLEVRVGALDARIVEVHARIAEMESRLVRMLEAVDGQTQLIRAADSRLQNLTHVVEGLPRRLASLPWLVSALRKRLLGR